MEFFDVVRQRRSTRTFAQRSVAEEKLRCILEAANQAPSAGNLQSFEIFMVTGKRKREELARAAHEQLFVACAPVSLVFCANPSRSSDRYGKRAEKLYAVQDATIACTFAMLAATAMGIGSVWVGAFEPDEVRRIVGAPAGVSPVAVLPIGYAAERPEPPERRGVEDLVHSVN
jgi:nitroreductase